MTATALIGLQWGDEGKGKMVDMLTADADFVVRCQGGSNAGHTVKVGEDVTILHLVPSGILHPDTQCIVGNGVVVDPVQLIKEIDQLEARGISVRGRLHVSDRAHVVLPYHRLLDAAQEDERGSNKIGTTGRGIGPAYEDKVGRRGVRIGDLSDFDRLKNQLEALYCSKADRLPKDAPDAETVAREYSGFGEKLAPFIADTVRMLIMARREDRGIFLEGAQGSLLDIDFGTYPFVTSSNSVVGGLLTGCGLPARGLTGVVGVAKAYSTRVGEGPYPTELFDDLGAQIRERGGEFGTTTGRPRRCGWFDAVAARFAVEINGVDTIVLTKADVLSGIETLEVCTAYEYSGDHQPDFPSDLKQLVGSKPIYETLDGWKEDISSMRDYDELPDTLKRYVAFLEECCRARVGWISVGPGRDAIIECPNG